MTCLFGKSADLSGGGQTAGQGPQDVVRVRMPCRTVVRPPSAPMAVDESSKNTADSFRFRSIPNNSGGPQLIWSAATDTVPYCTVGKVVIGPPEPVGRPRKLGAKRPLFF